MKKVFSVAISVIFALTMGISAFAVDSNDSFPTANTASVEINEFSMLRTLSEQTEEELQEAGYNEEQINTIENYESVYYDHVVELNELDDEVLLKHGYSEQQIEIIRNFTGTEAEMNEVSSEVSISATTVNFTGGIGTYTRGRLAYSWQWTGYPTLRMQDILAVTWNNWDIESQGGYVYYYDINTGDPYTGGTNVVEVDFDDNTTTKAGHKFHHRPPNDSSLASDYCYAKRGSGYFNVRSDVHTLKDFFYYIEYGHTTVQLVGDAGFSIPNSGTPGFSGSISLKTGIKKVGAVEGSYKFPE